MNDVTFDLMATLSKPKAARGASFIVSAILNKLWRGEYAPGQRLIEADIAKEFSVSRAAVGESLRMLLRDGVLELSPSRGMRIRVLDQTDLVDAIEALGPVIATAMHHLARKVATGEIAAELVVDRLIPLRDNVVSAAQRGLTYELFACVKRYNEAVSAMTGNLPLARILERNYSQHFHTQLLPIMQRRPDPEHYVGYITRLTAAILKGDPLDAFRQSVLDVAYTLAEIAGPEYEYALAACLLIPPEQAS